MKFHPTRFSLRGLLLADAALCLLSALILVFGGEAIGTSLQIPPALLFYAGLALLPIGAFMAVVALKPGLQRLGTLLIVAGNLVWAFGSVVLPAAGWIAPTAPGVALLAGQAGIVGLLAWLEYRAWRALGQDLAGAVTAPSAGARQTDPAA